jgi:hypothetical protein
MMKNEPISVITQMTTKTTRPIEREPPPVYFAHSPRSTAKFPPLEQWGIQNGANISQVFLEASKFLHAFVSRGFSQFHTLRSCSMLKRLASTRRFR